MYGRKKYSYVPIWRNSTAYKDKVKDDFMCEEKIKALKRKCISILDQYTYLTQNHEETNFIDEKIEEIIKFVELSQAKRVKDEAASAVQGA